MTSSKGDQLYRLTLQVPRLKDFPVKRLTATETQLDVWNLHALQRPNLKSKIKDKSIPVVEKLEATGLDLDFATKQKRDRFESHFKVVSNARNEQVHQFRTGRQVAVSQAHRPTRRLSHAATLPRRDSGQAGSETTIRGIPPTLSEIPRFSIISLTNDADPYSAEKKKIG